MQSYILTYRYKNTNNTTIIVNRIKKLSIDVLAKYKENFSADFADNKKELDKIAVIYSKSLKNKLAGFITKLIKREINKNKLQEKQNKVSDTTCNLSTDPILGKKNTEAGASDTSVTSNMTKVK